jgi:hypothetical protein
MRTTAVPSEWTHRATPYAAASRDSPGSFEQAERAAAEMVEGRSVELMAPVFQASLAVTVSVTGVAMQHAPSPDMSAEGESRPIGWGVPIVRIVAIVRVIVIRIVRSAVVGAAIKRDAVAVESASAVKASSEASVTSVEMAAASAEVAAPAAEVTASSSSTSATSVGLS